MPLNSCQERATDLADRVRRGSAKLPESTESGGHTHPSHGTPSPPRVLLAGKLDALDAPGGGEVQMGTLAESIAAKEACVRPWRPWEESLSTADAVHLFGSVPEHLALAEAAHRRGVPVLLSTIAWFDLASYWREPASLPARLTACARYLARAAFPRLSSWRRRLYHTVDLLLPNSEAEARQLVRHFGVPEERIHVVPNGADSRFASVDPDPFLRREPLRDFVLCAGRIEPRKNQLGLLRAMRGTNVPIVILGDVVPGHEAYARQCRREAAEHVRFLGRVDHDDPFLAGAYAACAALVLPSWFETPGLAAIEAGMSGVPLVLPRAGCAREYFGEHAAYVKPCDTRGMRRAVLAAVARKRSDALAAHVRQNFSLATVAEATLEGYRKVI